MRCPQPSSRKTVVRFGPFELDPDIRELRKHGQRIRLQDQPLAVLLALLEHHGELVSREKLHERLWAADTLVDFDHGLNNAIKRLREALHDSAINPLFIETIPRSGYRFIAPIALQQPLPVSDAIAARVSVEGPAHAPVVQARHLGIDAG